MRPPLKVRPLFEGHEDYLTVSRDVEGNRVVDGRMVLGMRAGPSRKIGNLLHEMAHLTEIDDERCHLFGWGLTVPEVVVLGRVCPEPMTFQCSIRELRVTAIQKVLCDHLGIRMSLASWGELLQYLPDWWAYRQYFTVSEDATYDSPELRKAIHADLRERVASLSVDAVLAEWNRKCNLLREVLA